MSIRDKYEQRRAANAHRKAKPISMVSAGGKTQLVAVVRDKDGNPKFSETFPADLKEQVLEQLGCGCKE